MPATLTAPAAPDRPDRITDAGLATVAEAADFLSVSRRTIYAMLDARSLPSVVLPGVRARRIPWATLRRIAADGLVPEVPQSATD